MTGILASSIPLTMTRVDFRRPPGVLSWMTMHSAPASVALSMLVSMKSAVAGLMLASTEITWTSLATAGAAANIQRRLIPIHPV